MLNKNVCPNCGQLYDTELAKCPLCGTAPQVVEVADPVQRKRISDSERKQRRAARKEAEQEARRRRKDAQFQEDVEEERRYEEEEARRKEEKRRLKEEKKAARRAVAPAQPIAEAEPAAQETPVPAEAQTPAAETPVQPANAAADAAAAAALAEAARAEAFVTPGPARDGRKPLPVVALPRDRRRIPRIFLALSSLVLFAALVVGGSYLLWKQGVVKLPIYDELAAKKGQSGAAERQTDETDTAAGMTTVAAGDAVSCRAISLAETELTFDTQGAQTQLGVTLLPSDTTDERSFSSSDEAVVKVSPVGIVTAVGPGSAVITVTCGEQTAACTVTCDFAEASDAGQTTVNVDSLILVKEDMTFFASGENYVLSVTNIPAGTPVEWRSLDESVCTVDAAGHVTAVGEGTTRVIATVGEHSAECWVRCKFK